MYEHLKQLHEQQLWSNLCQLGAVALAVTANNAYATGGVGVTPSATGKDAISAAPGPSSSSSSSVPAPSGVPSASPGSCPSGSGSMLSPRQRLHVTAMLGEAHLECREWRRAEALLKEALQIKKHLAKTKSSAKEHANVRTINLLLSPFRDLMNIAHASFTDIRG